MAKSSIACARLPQQALAQLVELDRFRRVGEQRVIALAIRVESRCRIVNIHGTAAR
jgi:hypothetical protein